MMKPADFEDPMELVGMRVPQGELQGMAECLVEEYLLLGCDERQLMLLFTRPCFRATHCIYREKGEAYVRSLIEDVRAKWTRNSSRGEQFNA